MADVRRDGVDLALLPVEREGVEAPPLLAPEHLVEALAKRRCIRFEALRELALAPDPPSELGEAPLCVVDIGLHLARRDRPFRHAPVVEELRVPRVLPGLVHEA